MSEKELKLLELNILKYIHNICQQHKLKYFLAYGTLLGAARHQGFIPWDDDIDIWMPREDYEKFIQIEKQKQGRYSLFSIHNRKDYYYEFAKIVDTTTLLEEIGFLPIKDYGVYVDIFPLDGIPNKIDKILLKYMFILKTAAVNRHPELNLKHKNRAKLFKIIGNIAKWIGALNYPKYIDQIAQKYPFNSSEFVGCSVFGNIANETLSKALFAQTINLEFEQYRFCAPIGFKECLSTIYGDNYMELPPIEMRHSVHNFIAYYKK